MAKKKTKAQQDKQLSKKTLYRKQKIQQNEFLWQPINGWAYMFLLHRANVFIGNFENNV